MTYLDSIILAIAAAKCPAPEVKNLTNLKWTDVDTLQVKISSKRCKEIYSPNHCLSKLYKIGFQDYIARCRLYTSSKKVYK